MSEQKQTPSLRGTARQILGTVPEPILGQVSDNLREKFPTFCITYRSKTEQ